MSRLLGLVDRLNPVLVKEVRQALNGRLFKAGFIVSLVGALLFSVWILMLVHAVDGADIALAMFGCLAVSIFVFIPFWAFVSMGAEWDENTFDLLVLSNLTPRRIVWGKLGSACLQMAVAFTAFLPFFVFAFLLRGVNLPTLLLVLAGALVVSPCASLVAIGLSSLTTSRFLRIVLMAAVAGGLLFLAGGAIGLAATLMRSSFFMPSIGEQALMVGAVATVAVAVALYFGELACSRLAHPEENRTTGPRVVLLLALAATLVWLGFILDSGGGLEALSGATATLQLGLVLPCAMMVLTPQRLGRRVERQVPRSRLLALLAAPFLATGSGALLFWLLAELFLWGGVLFLASRVPVLPAVGLSEWRARWVAWRGDGLGTAVGALGYAAFYLLVPTLLLRRMVSSARVGAFVRALVPLMFVVLCLGSILLPALLLFFFKGGFGSDPFEHVLDPFWTLDELWTGVPDSVGGGGLQAAIAVVLLAGLFHAVQGLRSLRQILVASAERRRMARRPDGAPAT